MTAGDELCDRVDRAWRSFKDALARTDLDAPTPSGWTGKEMLAHVAFWMETVPPYVTGAFRGDASAFEITFPSGYQAGEGAWPEADVHNAREAAWARDRSTGEVLDRAERAHRELKTFLTSVSDDELDAHHRYFEEIAAHLDTHRAEDLGA